MPDGPTAFKLLEPPLVSKHVSQQPHASMSKQVLAVGTDNSRRFLTPVLKGVQAQIGQFSGTGVAMKGHNPTLVAGLVVEEIYEM